MRRSETGFTEVASGCFVRRYPEWDTTIGVVVGAAGCLVIDTRVSTRHGGELHDDVRRLTPHRPVRWVVDTHAHFDHTFGNAAFDDAVIWAHENAAAALVRSGEQVKGLIRADPQADPAYPALTAEVLAAVLDTEYRLPDATFASVASIDLGDRYVELAHPGRGHTDGDVVVRVPDADVVFCGDLVEESGDPSFGEDSFPLDWPASLDLMVGMMTPGTVAVPGHGAPVDRAFVQDQRAAVATVAELVRSLYAQGVAREEALAVGGDAWPYPAPTLRSAVNRGYDALAQSAAAAGRADLGRRPAQPPSGVSRLPLA